MAIRGDTVRFQVTFKGFNGELFANKPTSVYFRLYDSEEVQIKEQAVPLTNILNGAYYYDLTIDSNMNKGIYTYEFEGVFADRPFVARDEITITFS